MTVGELTDAELSRWIVGKLEPNPTANSNYWRETQRPAEMSAEALDSGATSELLPRDMVNDPTMTLILLSRCSFYKIDVALGEHRVEVYHPTKVKESYYGYGKTLGRAVAEAFALANGWKP